VFTGKPKRDENGHIIEDEFSQMPLIQQFFSRMWKEMDYYKRVCLATQIEFGVLSG
jgi:import inner membrane translocase subunit TIM50